MIAVDTNILVYAHRGDSSFHENADAVVTELAESGKPWSIPFPCVHEFLSVVTNTRIYSTPTPLTKAVEQLERWFESPSISLLSERDAYWSILKQQSLEGRISGAKIHDARIVSLCIENGVQTLWSADRDFSRFSGIKVVNPIR